MHPPSDYNYYNRYLNMDICRSCRLECPSCDRVNKPHHLDDAVNISLEGYKKVIETFPNIMLSGNLSDPIYHPKFLDILKLSKSVESMCISTNGSGKKMSWWDKVIEYSKDIPNLRWIFALDGLPKDSHKYRVHQDGEKVWEVMKHLASQGLNIEWQYIVFNYNEDNIEECRKMAEDHNIYLFTIHSHRIPEELRPSSQFIEIKPVETHEIDAIEKLHPLCVHENRAPAHINTGHFVPCCWTDSARDEFGQLGFYDDELKLENKCDIISDIFHSKLWKDFFHTIQYDQKNAPRRCKEKCGVKNEPI